MESASNKAIAFAARHRDEARRAASRVGVPLTPLAVMEAQQAQAALERAHHAVHAPVLRPHREAGAVPSSEALPVAPDIAEEPTNEAPVENIEE